MGWRLEQGDAAIEPVTAGWGGNCGNGLQSALIPTRLCDLLAEEGALVARVARVLAHGRGLRAAHVSARERSLQPAGGPQKSPGPAVAGRPPTVHMCPWSAPRARSSPPVSPAHRPQQLISGFGSLPVATVGLYAAQARQGLRWGRVC